MDFSRLAALHADGHDETAGLLFAQMCREALYGGHGVPPGVLHLVHYTTLETLTSMLGVVATAAEKYPLATRVPTGGADEHGSSVGHLRLYDTFSSNDPNEGGFFINAADALGRFRRRYKARLVPVYGQVGVACVPDVTDVRWGRRGSGQPHVLENIR